MYEIKSISAECQVIHDLHIYVEKLTIERILYETLTSSTICKRVKFNF